MAINRIERAALVTGSTRGLGLAIARRLARKGVNIIIHGRNESAARDAVEIIMNEAGITVQSFICDANDPFLIKRNFSSLMRSFGDRLDILVNNVGNIETTGGLFDLTEDDWRRSFDLTFMSMVRFSLAAYPWLKKSGRGRIINIGSLAALQPSLNPRYAHYAAAKAAMLPVAKIMANDFAKDNILVNTICPSTLHGGGWYQNVKRRAERDGVSEQEAELKMAAEGSAKSPLGRLGETEDVANLVAFLASDEAKYITGQVFCVDGGIKRSAV